MSNDEFIERYEEFLSKNKKIIIGELESQYIHYRSNFSSFWSAQGFGSHIVLPLFVAFAAISTFFLDAIIVRILAGLLLIILLILAYNWWISLSEKICDRFFSMYEYEKVILKCTNWSKQKELRQANSEDEIDAIEDFYDLCQRQVVKEFFSYR